MNDDMLRKGVKSKKEIESVATELGYSSALEAANDLRELGLLDEQNTAKSETPVESEIVSTLSRERVLDIHRTFLGKKKLERLPFLTGVLLKEKFTCDQFSFLMKGFNWSSEEKELFENVIQNITDLENAKHISWHYSNVSGEMTKKYKLLYPEMHSGKKLDKKPRPITPELWSKMGDSNKEVWSLEKSASVLFLSILIFSIFAQIQTFF